MKFAMQMPSILAATVLTLAGCAAGGMQGGQAGQTHLSAAQCSDLTDLRNKAPATRERNRSELAALEAAGYRPDLRFDPYYPDDLRAAQRQVDIWYQTECPQAHAG
ncbi:DUF4148 domain-containing protein [Paraburkholderia sp. ZP32-5]|uniref:DUF4148 domain-containing protein n=1 Tax=Paraburkholderia sp. ZP32-5 TaxID=2883245 RepID=UPI001F217E81|nr:DUF4148 domain-containing protein [Paraburkholderia sp. ZP32-5]